MTVQEAAQMMLYKYGTTTSEYFSDLNKIDREIIGLCQFQLEQVWRRWNEISGRK